MKAVLTGMLSGTAFGLLVYWFEIAVLHMAH